jgi:hypothetical protein
MLRLVAAVVLVGSICGADRAGADLRSGVAAIGAAATGRAITATNKPLAAQRAKVLLKLGSLQTEPEDVRLTEPLAAASRQALGELPGVRVLEETEDANVAAAVRKPPVVMITGKLSELGQKDDGGEILISAKVEYFVHRMPGQSIAAVVSGAASARVAPTQMKKRDWRERLERSLVQAAVESAVKKSAPALKAAAD